MEITWSSVLAWRTHRQMLASPGGSDPVQIARRLCGIQAQVASSAAMAVAVRQDGPGSVNAEGALSRKELVKTWAMRGTLHLLPVDVASSYLSLIAAGRPWEKPAWQRTFATAEQVGSIGEAVSHALDGRVLTREELIAEVIERTGDSSVAEALGSGWGAVLKPLAFQGLLCHGPGSGRKVTFTRPDSHFPGWRPLPTPEEAAATVIPAYLGAYGPATIEVFDQWLSRGATKKSALRAWVSGLGDRLSVVEVEGQKMYARTEDVDDIASTEPSEQVRLLPAFDQSVLGPGTKDTQMIPAARRPEVSKAAGRIAPVVLVRGRVGGVWESTGTTLSVTLWKETGDVPRDMLDAEADRISELLRQDLTVSVTVS